MEPTDKKVRSKIEWMINGSPVKSDEWICTQYVGRNRLYHFDFDKSEIVLFTARIPKSVFFELYSESYEEELEWIKEEPEAELSRDEKFLREFNYPSISELTGEKFFIVRNQIVDSDTEFLELAWMEERETKPRIEYAVQRVIEVVENTDSILVHGIAVK